MDGNTEDAKLIIEHEGSRFRLRSKDGVFHIMRAREIVATSKTVKGVCLAAARVDDPDIDEALFLLAAAVSVNSALVEAVTASLYENDGDDDDDDDDDGGEDDGMREVE